MMSEAVRIADKVMAYLRAKKDNTLFLDAHCEGETFPFALARKSNAHDTAQIHRATACFPCRSAARGEALDSRNQTRWLSLPSAA